MWINIQNLYHVETYLPSHNASQFFLGSKPGELMVLFQILMPNVLNNHVGHKVVEFSNVIKLNNLENHLSKPISWKSIKISSNS